MREPFEENQFDIKENAFLIVIFRFVALPLLNSNKGIWDSSFLNLYL